MGFTYICVQSGKETRNCCVIGIHTRVHVLSSAVIVFVCVIDFLLFQDLQFYVQSTFIDLFCTYWC